MLTEAETAYIAATKAYANAARIHDFDAALAVCVAAPRFLGHDLNADGTTDVAYSSLAARIRHDEVMAVWSEVEASTMIAALATTTESATTEQPSWGNSGATGREPTRPGVSENGVHDG